MFLVFDFDGTLADTRVAFREAFDEAAGSLGVQRFRVEDEAHLRTLEASEVLRAHGIVPAQFSEFTHLLKQGMEARRSEISLVPGIDDVLRQLARMERDVGLITSNSEALVRSVLAESLDAFRYVRFDVAIRTKHTELEAAASECFSLGQLQYIGDEIRDYQAAVAAKVGFTAVTWGFNTEASLRKEGCNSFVNNPGELLLLSC